MMRFRNFREFYAYLDFCVKRKLNHNDIKSYEEFRKTCVKG
jgi:hypothetical protein